MELKTLCTRLNNTLHNRHSKPCYIFYIVKFNIISVTSEIFMTRYSEFYNRENNLGVLIFM